MPVYRRSYLVRQVEVYQGDPPDGLDPDEFVDFDEWLVENGEVVDSYVEYIDDDGLEIEEVT
jgi:hypothetical protein